MTAYERNWWRHPWLAVVVLVGVAALCTALGFWQLGRAGDSRAIASRYAAAAELPSLGRPPEDGAELRYRRLEVAGRYEPQRQFLIDNIVEDGVPGYYVLTPFRPQNGSRRLIVNRGWVAANPDRRVLPNVGVDSAERRIAGRIDTLPAPGLRLGEGAEPGDEPVLVLSYPTMHEIEARLGRPVFGYQVLLDGDLPDGFERDWRAPALEPSRHIAYAGQWWLFAAVAALAAAAVGWRELRGNP